MSGLSRLENVKPLHPNIRGIRGTTATDDNDLPRTRTRSTRNAAKAPPPPKDTPEKTPAVQIRERFGSDSELSDEEDEVKEVASKQSPPSSLGKENARLWSETSSGDVEGAEDVVFAGYKEKYKSPRLAKDLDKKTSTSSNIHIGPKPPKPKTSQPKPPKRPLTYDKKSIAARAREEARAAAKVEKKRFQKLKAAEEKDPPKKTFKGLKPIGTEDDTPRSSFILPSSAPNSSCEIEDPEDDEDDEDLTSALDDTTPRCDLCEEPIDPYTKEQFEDEHHLRKKDWTYKWQTRFCEYHRQFEGRQTWKDKGYPEIDWKALPERLKKPVLVARIKSLLDGNRRSKYQSDQEKVVKSRSKTLQQTVAAEEDGAKRGGAGYYGYRGERLLSEHIMQHFGSDLRARATKDKVITAAGVSGGLSGFINAVLVPELAVGLIIEDLGKTEAEAMDILTESAELGDVMHPEVDDQTKEVIELDD